MLQLAELSSHSELQVLKRRERLDSVQTTSIGESFQNVGVEGKEKDAMKISERDRKRSKEMRE